MKLAVMQPYFFPYIGYFTLLGTVDRFVFYDDVQYIKNGWINRNRILLGGEPSYITVPLLDASASSLINEVKIADVRPWKRKMLESIRHAYGAAPFFAPVNELIRRVVLPDRDRISELAKASIYSVADYLLLDTAYVHTSAAYGNSGLRGVERVKDVCRIEAASEYINLPGGRSLYAADAFSDCGVSLHFVNPLASPYRQFADTFHPHLSIIDVLMHNDPANVRDMLVDAKAH